MFIKNRRHLNGGKIMFRKFLTAILSAVIFSFILGLMTYLTYTSNSIWISMGFFLLYSAPVYVISGIPLSYLIDSVIKRINFSSPLARHYSRYGLFILAGIVVALIYTVILTIVDERFVFLSQASWTYVIGGIIAALVYYYVSLVMDRKNNKPDMV